MSDERPAAQPDPVGVFVVDDHPIVLEGMRIVLEGADDLRLIGSANRPAEAIAGIELLEPEVVLLDVRLGADDPVALTKSLAASHPGVAVLLFSADLSHPSIPAALAAGAGGIISKNVDPEILRNAIRAAARHESIPGDAARRVQATGPALTPREREVLRHVAIGQTNAEIAADLGLTPSTVKTYWQTSMQKLGVRNRAEAIGAAHRLGLLDDAG